MKQYLTEFDELQAALRKVRIDENVMPYHMGRLVEDEDSYNKIQKLLDCPQMAGSHKYLYDLDVENLQEGEIDKINQLFDLGVKKGYIDNSFEEEFQKEENPDAIIADEPESCPACKSAADVRQQFSAPVPCWTILYSATKNGEIKSGECYSNAVSVSAAKADCLAKLAKFGYENVSVLAIEAGDPDMCGADDVNEFGKNPYKAELNEATEQQITSVAENILDLILDILQINEDDAAIKDVAQDVEAAIKKAGLSGKNAEKAIDMAVRMAKKKADPEKVEKAADAIEKLVKIDESGKNPYVAGMKVVTGGKVSTSAPAAKKQSKKLKEDDEESDDTDNTEDTENSGDEGSDDAESDDAGSEDGEDESGSDGDSDGAEGDGELDDSKKAQYKNEYRRIFQEVMTACKFGGKSFNDLTIDEKVKFFTKLKERWTKADPKEFMSDKEQDQLESITIEGSDDAESDDAEGSDDEGSDDTEGEDTESSEDEGSDDTEGEDTESFGDEGSDADSDEADGEGSDDAESDDAGSEDEGSEDEGSEDEGSEDEE